MGASEYGCGQVVGGAVLWEGPILREGSGDVGGACSVGGGIGFKQP